MPRLEIHPFSTEFLGAAAELLAARHRAHRAVEPLLPKRYEDPAATAEEIAALAGSEGASGAVALRDWCVAGYLLGIHRRDEIWGGRMTNLLSSRFWPARGFRPTFLRLYRHIP